MENKEKIEIEIIKSNRKTIAIEVRQDLRVIVRAPKRASNREIMKFVEQKQDWIAKHLAYMQIRYEETRRAKEKQFTDDDIRKMKDEAKRVIPDRVKYYAGIMGVTFGKITIKNQKTRWGSCSSKGNLNFNCLLMLTPDKVRDYVVIHELCHLKQMNHSKMFWAEVEKVMPDYKVYRQWLSQNGNMLIERMK
jgi:predicted metal-dependent hydrolase